MADIQGGIIVSQIYLTTGINHSPVLHKSDPAFHVQIGDAFIAILIYSLDIFSLYNLLKSGFFIYYLLMNK